MDNSAGQFSQKLTKSDYSALLSSLNRTALVSMTNAQGDIIYANKKFIEISKYSPDEILGQNHRILKSGEQPDELFDSMWSTISSGQVWRGEIKNRAKDGSYYWVDTSIAPIIGKNGKPERYISVRFLITEQKQREQLLEEANAKAEAILASIGDGLIATDSGGNIAMINPKAQHLLGWRAEDVLGKPLNEILTVMDKNEKSLPANRRPMHRALAGLKPISPTEPHFYVRKDGSKFPVAITAAPIILESDFIGAIDVFRDITREKDIEKAKDDFISIASHQLRTPATSVKQYLGMLLADYGGKLNKDQRILLQHAYDSNERQIHIVNDLLRVAKIDAGQININKEPTDIVVLIKNILKDNADRAKKQNHTLSFTHAPKQIILNIDCEYIRMVIENILENAIKYTPPDKQISIKVTENTRSTRIVISDQGIGMNAQDISKIFDKFSRLESILSASVDGTGLGLYWARRIIKLHEGSIIVKSKPGIGSSFIIGLPTIKKTSRQRVPSDKIPV